MARRRVDAVFWRPGRGSVEEMTIPGHRLLTARTVEMREPGIDVSIVDRSG
ncbi:MAG: hypothetical protein ACHQDC_00150 [Acidimicrobiales bacterium]